MDDLLSYSKSRGWIKIPRDKRFEEATTEIYNALKAINDGDYSYKKTPVIMTNDKAIKTSIVDVIACKDYTIAKVIQYSRFYNGAKWFLFALPYATEFHNGLSLSEFNGFDEHCPPNITLKHFD